MKEKRRFALFLNGKVSIENRSENNNVIRKKDVFAMKCKKCESER